MIEISKLKMAKEAALNLNLFEKTAYNAYGIYPQEAYSQGGQYPGAPDAPRFMSPLVQGLGGLGIAGMGAYSLLKSTPQVLASPVMQRSTGLEAALAMLLASGTGYGLKYWQDKGKPAASAATPAASAATPAASAATPAASAATPTATPTATPAATFQVGPTETFYNEFSPSATRPAGGAAGSRGGGKPPTKATNSDASSSTALHKIKRLQQQGVMPEVYKLSPASRNVTNTVAGRGGKSPTKATNLERLRQLGILPERHNLSSASRNITNMRAGGGSKPPTKATNSASSSTTLHKIKRLQAQGILPEVYNLSPASRNVTNTGAGLVNDLKRFGVKKPSIDIDKVRAVRSLLDKLKGVIGKRSGII